MSMLSNNTPDWLEELLGKPQTESAHVMHRRPITDIGVVGDSCKVQNKELGGYCLILELGVKVPIDWD